MKQMVFIVQRDPPKVYKPQHWFINPGLSNLQNIQFTNMTVRAETSKPTDNFHHFTSRFDPSGGLVPKPPFMSLMHHFINCLGLMR